MNARIRKIGRMREDCRERVESARVRPSQPEAEAAPAAARKYDAAALAKLREQVGLLTADVVAAAFRGEGSQKDPSDMIPSDSSFDC
jgi:hypothetical protein